MEETKTLKKKKSYVKPEMMVEEFTPDQMVCSACWGVACDASTADAWEKKHYVNGSWGDTWWDIDCKHGTGHCAQSSNQVIRTSDWTMTEIGTDGLGTLDCTRYTDDTYTETAPFSTVKAGDKIFWTTAAGVKVWHHQGTVFETNSLKPNMS